MFSDDDLKRFKEWAIDCYPSDKFYCRTNEIKALLARLEAAEKAYYEYRNDTEVRHTPRQVELGIVWRKAAGK